MFLFIFENGSHSTQQKCRRPPPPGRPTHLRILYPTSELFPQPSPRVQFNPIVVCACVVPKGHAHMAIPRMHVPLVPSGQPEWRFNSHTNQHFKTQATFHFRKGASNRNRRRWLSTFSSVALVSVAQKWKQHGRVNLNQRIVGAEPIFNVRSDIDQNPNCFSVFSQKLICFTKSRSEFALQTRLTPSLYYFQLQLSCF